MFRVIVRAFNKDGYQMDILIRDEQQVRVNDVRIKGGNRGEIIDPAVFPEMTHFEIIIEKQDR